MTKPFSVEENQQLEHSVAVHLLSLPPTSYAPLRAAQLRAEQAAHLATLGNKRARTFFWGRTLLTHLLDEVHGVDQWRLEERSQLPPKLHVKQGEQSPAMFSISHSGELIAIAISTCSQAKLGVDIERINPRRRIEVAASFCNSTQLESLNAVANGEQNAYLTQLWTQKEAWFKARQMPVLNADLKPLAFTGAPNKDADTLTAYLPPSYYLSVHIGRAASQRINLKVVDHQASLHDNTPEIGGGRVIAPNWQGFLSHPS